MALKRPLRVKQTTTTSGTGTLSLVAPDGDTRAFGDHFGAVVVPAFYVIQAPGIEETGVGHYDGTVDTFARDVEVITSSNGGALVALPAGTKDVYIFEMGAGRYTVTNSGGLTALLADASNIIEFTGTIGHNLNLPQLSKVPQDYDLLVRNSGSAIYIITPFSGDDVEGVSSLALQPGVSALLYRDDTQWRLFYFGSGVGYTPGYLGIPQNIQNATYAFVLTDEGKHVYHTSGSAHTWTIPANASVAFEIGTVILLVNEHGGGNVTIAITSDTLRWGALTGSRTLAADGVATLLKVSATLWRLTGSGLS